MSAPNEYKGSRIEQQLSYLMNGSGVLPDPKSRIEQQIDHIIKNGTSTEREIRGEVTEIKSDVDAMKSIGRYLSVWDCTAGLPQTDPTTMPYTYETGDYYRVGVVAAEGGTNYKPSGTTYTGAASTTEETGDPALGDIYIYDGTSWGLLKGAVLLDAEPIEGSTNAVTSGGVWTAINNVKTKVSTALPTDGILVNNTEYRIGTVSALTVNGFGAGATGYAELWSVMFTAGTGITVSVPASVVWAVATPVFEAGKTYWLSFTPMGSGYLGVWSVSA